jgi:hypothetical protein
MKIYYFYTVIQKQIFYMHVFSFHMIVLQTPTSSAGGITVGTRCFDF